MAYRPQANGTVERMVQTLTRAIKMYVADADQKDWDDYAEKLTFAIKTAQDRVRGDTSFYLIYGWYPRSTLETTLPLGSIKTRDPDPRSRRYSIRRHYQQSRATVYKRRKIAILDRADRHNANIDPHNIQCGRNDGSIWL